MASGYSGSGNWPEFYGVGGRSIPEVSGNNNPQMSLPMYRNQIHGILQDQIAAGYGISGKRTLADFQAAQQLQQQQQQFHNQAALNAFLLRSVKPRTFQDRQSPIDLTAVNNLSCLGETAKYYTIANLRSQMQKSGSGLFGGVKIDNRALTGVPCNQPVQNRNQESEKMLNSLKELEKQLLADDDASGDDDVSVITNSNSEWIQSLVSPNLNPNPYPNPNPVSSSPSSSSSSSSPSTASTTTASVTKQTVMEIVTAIAEGKTEIASEILARVSQTPNPKRNSEEKLVSFMETALRSKINPAENPVPPASELYGKEHVVSTQVLYELSPCFKLGFMAANLAILYAAGNDEGMIHVIDFDIGEGGQYVNLLHALSTRRNCKNPPVVKITAVANISDEFIANGREERLKAVGDLLNHLSARLGISLSFNIVTSLKLNDLSRESLRCDPDEPLAVNLAFKLYQIPDESVCIENPRDELLRRVKGLNPRVVTLVEQEMNTNTAPFLNRVSESCASYGALLDSVESTVPSSNLDRVKLEEGIKRKLVNAVACDGMNRIERCEVFGKWQMRMNMAGFELLPLSEKIAESMKSRLRNGNRVHPGFTVKEDNGGVCFGWMGRTLAVASAWR